MRTIYRNIIFFVIYWTIVIIVLRFLVFDDGFSFYPLVIVLSYSIYWFAVMCANILALRKRETKLGMKIVGDPKQDRIHNMKIDEAMLYEKIISTLKDINCKNIVVDKEGGKVSCDKKPDSLLRWFFLSEWETIYIRIAKENKLTLRVAIESVPKPVFKRIDSGSSFENVEIIKKKLIAS